MHLSILASAAQPSALRLAGPHDQPVSAAQTTCIRERSLGPGASLSLLAPASGTRIQQPKGTHACRTKNEPQPGALQSMHHMHPPIIVGRRAFLLRRQHRRNILHLQSALLRVSKMKSASEPRKQMSRGCSVVVDSDVLRISMGSG